MSQNKIQLYDDNVLKLTIKQGTEQERFNISSTIGNGGSTFYGSNNENINILDPVSITTVPGSFSSGELAYTRDTGRVFVGSITNETTPSNQITFGGTLVGNKYLGSIDSKRDYRKIYGDEDDTINNGTPLNLSTRTGTLENGEPGLLLENSLYRTYNFLAEGSNTPQTTSDGKWARLSFYNPKYDAYDGDFMYDIYRNALILFDHNIKPSTENYADQPTASESKVGGKRKTPLQPRILKDGTTTEALKTVKKHTEDMYGDGYVLLYNVIPDGDTLTFTDRQFDNDSGECSSTNDTLATNFSYNVIKLNKVPVNVLKEALDERYFIIPEEGATTKITLDTANINGSINIDDSNCPNNAILTYDKERGIVPVSFTLTKTGSDPINANSIESLKDWPDTDVTVKTYIDTSVRGVLTSPELTSAIKSEVAEAMKDIETSSPGSVATSEIIVKASVLEDIVNESTDDLENLLALITELHTVNGVVNSNIAKYFPNGITAQTVSIEPTEANLEESLDTLDEALNGTGEGEDTTGGIGQDIENMISLLRKLHTGDSSTIDKYFPGRGLENEE